MSEHSASSQWTGSVQPFHVGGDFKVETDFNHSVRLEVENNIESVMPSRTGESFIEANLGVSLSDKLSEVREERDNLPTAEFNLECLSTSEIDHHIDLSEENEMHAATKSNSVRAVHSAGDAPHDDVHETSVHTDQLDETLSVSKLHNMYKNESLSHITIDLECEERTCSVPTIEHFRLHEDTFECSEPSSYMPNEIEDVQTCLNESREMNDCQSESIPHSSSINKVNGKSANSDHLDETLCLSKLHNLSENNSFNHNKIEIECEEINDPVCESLTFEGKPNYVDVDSVMPADPTSDLYNVEEDNESKEILSHSVHTCPLDETLCLFQLHNISKNESLDHSKMEIKSQQIGVSLCEPFENERNSHQGNLIGHPNLSSELLNVVEDVPASLNEPQITELLECQEKRDSPCVALTNESDKHQENLIECPDLSSEMLNVVEYVPNSFNDSKQITELEYQEKSDSLCEAHKNESNSQQGNLIGHPDSSSDLPNVVEDVPASLNEPQITELLECQEKRDSPCVALTNESDSHQENLIECPDLSSEMLNVVEDVPASLNEPQITELLECQEKRDSPCVALTNESDSHRENLIECPDLSSEMLNVVEDVPNSFNDSKQITELEYQEKSDSLCGTHKNESNSQQGNLIGHPDSSSGLPNVVEDVPASLNEPQITELLECQEKRDSPCVALTNESDSHQENLIECPDLSSEMLNVVEDVLNVVEDVPASLSEPQITELLECQEKRDSPCVALTNESDNHQENLIECPDLSSEMLNVVEDVPNSFNDSKQITELEYQEKSDSLCGTHKNESNSHQGNSIKCPDLSSELLNVVEDVPASLNEPQITELLECQEKSDSHCEALTNESNSHQGNLIECPDLSSELLNVVEDVPASLNKPQITKLLECQEKSDPPCEALTNESKQNSHQVNMIECSDLSSERLNVVEDVPISLNESKQITELEYQENKYSLNEARKNESNSLQGNLIECTDLSSGLPHVEVVPASLNEPHITELLDCQEKGDSLCEALTNESKQNSDQGDIIECLDLSSDLPNFENVPISLNESKQTTELECQEKSDSSNGHDNKLNVHSIASSYSSSDLPFKLEENHVPCLLDENPCTSESDDVSKERLLDHKEMETECLVIGIPACESLAGNGKEPNASLVDISSNSSSETNFNDNNKNSLTQDMSITLLSNAASCQVLDDSPLDVSEQALTDPKRLSNIKNINNFTAITDQKPGDAMYVPTSDSNENNTMTCESGIQQSFMEITFANPNPVVLDQSLYCIKSRTSVSEYTLGEDSYNTMSNFMCADNCFDGDKTISEVSNDSHHVMQRSISDHVISQNLSLAIPDTTRSPDQMSNPNSLDNSSEDSRVQCEQQTEHTLLMKWPIHYHAELEMLQSQNQSLRNELELKSTAYSKLEADNLNTNEDLKEALEKCEDLSKKINHLEESLKQERANNNTISHLMHANEELLIEIGTLKNIERLYKEMKENEDEMVKQIKSKTSEEVKFLEDKISSLEKQLYSAHNDVKDLQLNNELHSKANSNLEETIESLNKNILETKKELSDLCIENKQLQNLLKLQKQANDDLENKTTTLKEDIAVLKSQNEAFWKGIVQRSDHEELEAITKENCKLHENLALHKNEIATLKLQYEVITKELDSKNNTIIELKTYKKKWKSSLMNLNVQLNMVEAENEQLKIELESQQVSLQEEVRSLGESISSLILEEVALSEKIAGDEITMGELTTLNHKQCLNIKLIEEEKSSLANEILRLEIQVESLSNTNSMLSSELDSCKNQLSDMHSLNESNTKLNEVINTLERTIHSYEEENEHNVDRLRGLGETLVSVMMSQDVESFQNLTILEDIKQQVSQLGQKADRLDGLLKIEKEKVEQLSDINKNLSNELIREKENLSRETELQSTVSELNNYIISLNEELMSEIFKFDAITYEKLELETMLNTFSDQINLLKDCENRLTKENDELKINLNLKMSETQRLIVEKDELLESAKIIEDNISSLRSEKEKLMLENAGLTSSIENCTSKINDLEKYCLENNNLKNTMINEIKSLTSNSDANYEPCSINDVFVKLMSVFLHKEEEVISALQKGYEEKIRSLQCSIDLQSSEEQNQSLKLKKELSEKQDIINQYKHDIALLEENLCGVQSEFAVKIEQIQKMEDCLLHAQNEKGSISDELAEVKNIHSKTIAEFEERLRILKDDIMNKDVTISDLLNNLNSVKQSEIVAMKSLEEKSQEINGLQVKIELLRNDITGKDLEISDLLNKENDLKQTESSVKISLEEKRLEINHLRDQIESITTALENNKNIIQKHLSDLSKKTEMCSSLETQLNCLNEQLKAHKILYDEDTLQLKEQINAKEEIIANLTETISKLNEDIHMLTEKVQGFTEKEEKEGKQEQFIKDLQETIERGQQHYNMLKDVVKSRNTEIDGLLKDLKCEKDLNSQLVSKNDAIIAQNYGLQKEVFELKEKIGIVETKLQSLLSSISILFPQEVSDEFKLDNTFSLLKSVIEESNNLNAQCKNDSVTIKKLEANMRNTLKRELDLKKQIASISAALKTTKDAKSEMEQQMFALFSNSVTTPANLVIKVKEIVDENRLLKSKCEGDLEDMIQENKSLNEECEIMNKHIKELEENLSIVLERESELKRVNSELKSRLEGSNSHPQECLHEILTLFPEAPSLNSAIELIRTALVEHNSLKEQLAEAKEDYASLDTECESMYKAYQEKETLLIEVWEREEALKKKEGEAREEIKRLNLELERLKIGSSSSPHQNPAGPSCGCEVLLAGLRSEVAARDAKLTALQLQIQTDNFPLRNTIAELELSLEQAKQRINELRGEMRRHQAQAQEDVTAQGLRTECSRCRDIEATLVQKDKDIVILKSLCKARKAKIAELEQAVGGKSAGSRALRPPLKENLQSSPNSGTS